MSGGWSPLDVLGPDLACDGAAGSWPARAREFARDVVGPIGEALDAMDPDEVTAPGSPVRDLLAEAHDEGFTRLGAEPRLGGLPVSAADELLVLEELATADAALAALVAVAPVPFRWAGALGSPSLVADVALPYLSGVRKDWIGCCAVAGPPAAVRAVPSAGGWLLSGETTAVPGGAIATHALVSCRADGAAAVGLAVVPLGSERVGRVLASDTLGLRGSCRARLALDRVPLRADHVIVAGEGPPPGASGAHADAARALLACGIGRAAYEGALRWAREAVWAGRPASGDGALLPQLHRMYTLIDAARGLVRTTYRSSDGRRLPDEEAFAHHAHATRAFAAAAAVEVAQAAMRLCGADATPHGVAFLDGSAFNPDKLLRDAHAAHPDPGGDAPWAS